VFWVPLSKRSGSRQLPEHQPPGDPGISNCASDRAWHRRAASRVEFGGSVLGLYERVAKECAQTHYHEWVASDASSAVTADEVVVGISETGAACCEKVLHAGEGS